MVDSTLVHFELADLIGDLNQNVGVIFQKDTYCLISYLRKLFVTNCPGSLLYKAVRIQTSFRAITKILCLVSFLKSSYSFTERHTQGEARVEGSHTLACVAPMWMRRAWLSRGRMGVLFSLLLFTCTPQLSPGFHQPRRGGLIFAESCPLWARRVPAAPQASAHLTFTVLLGSRYYFIFTNEESQAERG